MYPVAMREARQIAVKIDPSNASYAKFGIQDSITVGTRCIKGIPVDAEFIRYHWTGVVIALIFEHRSFDIVHRGESIPWLELEFEDI